jgi:hypothetical protein
MDDLSSNEAYICYGHLSQPNNATANFYAPTSSTKVVNYEPGQADTASAGGPYNASASDKNDNNKYATQWLLGRTVTLLKPNPPFVAPNKQEFLFRSAAAKGYSPLDQNSTSSDGGKWTLQSSRYDVAATSIDAFRNIVLDPKNAGPVPWWEMMSGFRFQGFPYPTRPLTADGMARTVPIFVPGCTQFIVEYAGDFLRQDPITGAITGTAFDALGTDGVIDFVTVPVAGGATGTGARRTRWYGAPRNVDTSDDKAGKPVILGSGPDQLMRDVVPLRDLLMSKGVPVPPDFFEREIDKRLPNNKDYGTIAAPTGSPPRPGAPYVSPVMGTPGLLAAGGNEYVAAWTPTQLSRGSAQRPRMIRITIVVDDPAGRTTDGQTYEYVFSLP